MIIVLIFLLLIFPIKLNAKLLILPENNYFCSKFFLFKFQLFKICLFVYNKKLYYKFSKNSPKEIKLNFSFINKPSYKFNFLILNKIDVISYLGLSNVMYTALLNELIRIISQNICHINDIELSIKSFPLFSDKKIRLKSNVCGFTNLLYLLISVIERIFVLGGKKNVQEQSN